MDVYPPCLFIKLLSINMLLMFFLYIFKLMSL